MAKRLKATTLLNAIEKSPILLSQYWKNVEFESEQKIIYHLICTNNFCAKQMNNKEEKFHI